MPRTVNQGKFPGRRGRPPKAQVAALKEAERQAEIERKENLPVYPMLEYSDLREKFDVDLRSVDPAAVTDIKDIHIPQTRSPYEWLQSWITQTGNPFLIKVDGIVVKFGGRLDPLEPRKGPVRHGTINAGREA